ncbi:MAG: DUF5691 domain-containing protein [Bacteroidota bacterium]
MIGEINATESAERALHAVTLDHFYGQAGKKLPSIDIKFEEKSIHEELEYASDEHYPILQQILDIDHQRIRSRLLTDWIKNVAASAKIVHPMHLVNYLNALLTVPKAAQALALPTLGKKGAWLAQQNSKYQKIESSPQDDIWSFGTAQQRRTFLSDLLKNDPERAVQMVTENWPTETKTEKRKHLKLFLEHPNPIQFPFVEHLYKEEFRYKEKESVTERAIRNILAKILLLNTDSTLYRATQEALDNYVVHEKSGFLSRVFQTERDFLSIPDMEDDFFNRQNMLETYGIDPNSSAASDYRTDQLYWFHALCSALPFEMWTVLSGMKPKSVFKSFFESEQYKTTVKGQKESILRNAFLELTSYHSNDELLLLLLNAEKDLETVAVLLSRLSPSVWEKYLSKNLNLVNVKTLDNCPHREDDTWSLNFSRIILNETVERLANKTNSYDYTIGLKISENIHIDITEHLLKLNNGKVQNNHQYGYWKNHIFDPIYLTVTMRNQIHQL